MSVKVYNQLILEGAKKDLEALINKCYGESVMEECKGLSKPYLTFNSYIKLDNDDRNNAYSAWGVSVDSLNDYVSSFERVLENLSQLESDTISEQKISFETHNGFVFKWVKEMAKDNPNVKIKYFVTDRITNYFASCVFEINSNNLEYEAKNYSSDSELRHKFLGYSLEEALKDELRYRETRLSLYSSDEKRYKLTSEDKLAIIKSEFSFLPKNELEELIKANL